VTALLTQQLKDLKNSRVNVTTSIFTPLVDVQIEKYVQIEKTTFRIMRNMGKVRTSAVKVITRQVIKEYESHLSPDSFEHNKDILGKVAKVQSKRFRNQIAGYITHQLKIKKLREESYED
jgi:small subunit ribosomal protein S17e